MVALRLRGNNNHKVVSSVSVPMLALTRKFVEVIANIEGLVVVIRVLVVDEFHRPWQRGRGDASIAVTAVTHINIKLTTLRGLLNVSSGSCRHRAGGSVALLFLTLAVVVDDVFDQQVVVAEHDGRVDPRQAPLQRLHLCRQRPQAGNAGERRPAGGGEERGV